MASAAGKKSDFGRSRKGGFTSIGSELTEPDNLNVPTKDSILASSNTKDGFIATKRRDSLSKSEDRDSDERSKFGQNQWFGVDRLVSACSKSIFRNEIKINQEKGEKTCKGENESKESQSLPFRLHVKSSGKFACEEIVSMVWNVLSSEVDFTEIN